MIDNQLPLDVIGHMAGLGRTSEPLEVCHSCQRAIIYATLAHLASSAASLNEGSPLTAMKHIRYAISVLVELAKVDFEAAVPGSDDLEQEDWEIAMMSFYQSRIEHYCDETTGAVVFEPHDGHGDPIGIPA